MNDSGEWYGQISDRCGESTHNREHKTDHKTTHLPRRVAPTYEMAHFSAA